ncbi:hypothetical protein WME91_37980 [Sorangium sp. So ce269]
MRFPLVWMSRQPMRAERTSISPPAHRSCAGGWPQASPGTVTTWSRGAWHSGERGMTTIPLMSEPKVIWSGLPPDVIRATAAALRRKLRASEPPKPTPASPPRAAISMYWASVRPFSLPLEPRSPLCPETSGYAPPGVERVNASTSLTIFWDM